MRRAVITGVGVVCSIGKDREHFWDNLAKGVCGIGAITLFDTSGFRGKLGAEIPDEYLDAGIRRQKRLSRCDIIGLTAFHEAVKMSGLDLGRENSRRIATVMGSGSGGLLSAEQFKRAYMSGERPRPTLLYPFPSSSFTDIIAREGNSKGFRTSISTACSSSSTAIGIAMDLIRDDRADIVITGGSESLSETTFSGFNSLRSVDEVPCRPFDRERKGISLGEGSAIFLVEEKESALSRNVTICGEIKGYGISGDAHHVTQPDTGGEGVALAIGMALKMAGIEKRNIEYINAHGTGTPANDLAETTAIKKAFGRAAYDIPVSSTKSMIGHCLGAAGALEAAASLLALNRGILPPTANYRHRDPQCDLNYLPTPAKEPVNTVLSLSLAFGGNNTALLLGSLS